MKISVIIPVYNSGKWLKKLWESLYNQTIYNRLEIIFVDDGSTDDSYKILKLLTKNQKNVTIYKQMNSGVSSARNLGVSKSSCPLIAFVDSDDYVDNDYFETLEKRMGTDIDMVISGFIAEYNNSSVYKCAPAEKIYRTKQEIIKEFLLGNIEPNCTDKLFKTSMVKQLKFNTQFIIAEDKLFLYEYLSNCQKVLILPEAKYHYNMNPQSVTKTIFNSKKLLAITVSEMILKDIKEKHPALINYAQSADIDVKCRIYTEIYKYHQQKEYSKEYSKLKTEIKKYSLKNKINYSTKKHAVTFILARISPKLYLIIKEKMKLQYKN